MIEYVKAVCTRADGETDTVIVRDYTELSDWLKHNHGIYTSLYAVKVRDHDARVRQNDDGAGLDNAMAGA